MEAKSVRNPFGLLVQLCERFIEKQEQRFVMPVVQTLAYGGEEIPYWTFPRDDSLALDEWKEGQQLFGEVDDLLAECQVEGYEIWQPRPDNLRDRLNAIVEALDKLRFWGDEVRQWPHDTPPEEARRLFQKRVDRFRTALAALEPLIGRMERVHSADSATGEESGNEESPPNKKEELPAVDLEQRTISFRGMHFDVTSVQALRWIKVLAERPGEWISARDLEQFDPELKDVRTDKLKPFLPEPISSLLESKSGAGSRLKRSI